MDIASAIVHAAPGHADQVRAQLARLRGLEIHGETPDGRFVVTAEDTADGTAAETVLQLHRLEGVLSAALIYQYSDTQEDTP
jgi:nitrate reductase NapD